MKIIKSLCFGLLFRVLLICYSVYHDSKSELKYTDIDYKVFTDAAYLILNPPPAQAIALGSPYDRQTYRYTPLLALLLTSNHTLHPQSGKLLFSLADILIGYLSFRLLLNLSKRQYPPARVSNVNGTSTASNNEKKIFWLVNLLWIWNPMIANISTRGSAESILGVLVIGCLASAESGRWNLSAIILGLAVHFKIYPFIYASSLLARIKMEEDRRRSGTEINPKDSALTKFLRKYFCWKQVQFGVISLTTFSLLNLTMYIIWGYPFIFHTYLYHLSRLDHRHNFSSYFYPIYLSFTSTSAYNGTFMAFVPQLLLSLGIGFLYGANEKGLAVSWFLQTFAFVTFNKVCTSQYFIWYILFLPFVLYASNVSLRRWIPLLIIWASTQALWLSLAFQLEMKARPVFRYLFFASLAHFIGNVWIFGKLVEFCT